MHCPDSLIPFVIAKVERRLHRDQVRGVLLIEPSLLSVTFMDLDGQVQTIDSYHPSEELHQAVAEIDAQLAGVHPGRDQWLIGIAKRFAGDRCGNVIAVERGILDLAGGTDQRGARKARLQHALDTAVSGCGVFSNP